MCYASKSCFSSVGLLQQRPRLQILRVVCKYRSLQHVILTSVVLLLLLVVVVGLALKEARYPANSTEGGYTRTRGVNLT
jgi:thiosulfate reductase cytochrome b subunit